MEEFYPPIEPHHTGFEPVNGGHSIYYEECGNPEGLPVIYFHGGPGVGCDEKDRRLFDPEKWRIVLIDQRGCGRSVPYGCIENNTTDDLARDIWNIRRRLGIKKAVLFGGSWGSTLALYYAIRFPEDALALILRGVFLGMREELDFLYKGGNGLFYPEAWERFLANVPENRRDDILGYFYERMSTGSTEEKQRFAFEMSRFEENLLHLEPVSQEEVDKETGKAHFESTGLLETYYFVNNCFMEEGFILNNVTRIPKVPISIVQGQYDMVCPPQYAYRLRRALENTGHEVAWNLVIAGHSKSDTALRSKLIEETNHIHTLLAQTP